MLSQTIRLPLPRTPVNNVVAPRRVATSASRSARSDLNADAAKIGRARRNRRKGREIGAALRLKRRVRGEKDKASARDREKGPLEGAKAKDRERASFDIIPARSVPSSRHSLSLARTRGPGLCGSAARAVGVCWASRASLMRRRPSPSPLEPRERRASRRRLPSSLRRRLSHARAHARAYRAEIASRGLRPSRLCGDAPRFRFRARALPRAAGGCAHWKGRFRPT